MDNHVGYVASSQSNLQGSYQQHQGAPHMSAQPHQGALMVQPLATQQQQRPQDELRTPIHQAVPCQQRTSISGQRRTGATLSSNKQQGGAAHRSKQQSNGWKDVYDSSFSNVYSIPMACIFHLPHLQPSSSSTSRRGGVNQSTRQPPPYHTNYVLCRNFSPAEIHSCSKGASCKFVHADVTNAVVQSVHVNYAYKDLNACEMDRLPAGKTLRVLAPNNRPPLESVRTEMIIRTRGAELAWEELMTNGDADDEGDLDSEDEPNEHLVCDEEEGSDMDDMDGDHVNPLSLHDNDESNDLNSPIAAASVPVLVSNKPEITLSCDPEDPISLIVPGQEYSKDDQPSSMQSDFELILPSCSTTSHLPQVFGRSTTTGTLERTESEKSISIPDHEALIVAALVHSPESESRESEAGDIALPQHPHDNVAEDEDDASPPVPCGGGRAPAVTTANKKLSHCAHYFFNRVCNRGAKCNFIHMVHLDNNAVPGQRAPPPPTVDPIPTKRGKGGRNNKLLLQQLQVERKQQQQRQQHRQREASAGTNSSREASLSAPPSALSQRPGGPSVHGPLELVGNSSSLSLSHSSRQAGSALVTPTSTTVFPMAGGGVINPELSFGSLGSYGGNSSTTGIPVPPQHTATGGTYFAATSTTTPPPSTQPPTVVAHPQQHHAMMASFGSSTTSDHHHYPFSTVNQPPPLQSVVHPTNMPHPHPPPQMVAPSHHLPPQQYPAPTAATYSSPPGSIVLVHHPSAHNHHQVPQHHPQQQHQPQHLVAAPTTATPPFNNHLQHQAGSGVLPPHHLQPPLPQPEQLTTLVQPAPQPLAHQQPQVIGGQQQHQQQQQQLMPHGIHHQQPQQVPGQPFSGGQHNNMDHLLQLIGHRQQ